MTREAFEQINRNRIARGQKPLTFTESPSRKALPPLQTAASLIGAPTVRELRNGKQTRGPSHLEEKFARLWADVGGPPLEREFKFHSQRRWRADFCHAPSRTLIEIEGGAFNGRHTKAKGFLADAEKYLAAYLAGYALIRLTAPQLTTENVTAIALRIAIQKTG